MSVISLRRSVSELDHMAGQRQALQGAWARCIEAAGQYAVELCARDAAEFRRHLKPLAERALQAGDAEASERLAADFRGELRAYRDRVQAEAGKLRAEVAEAMNAVQQFITSVSTSGDDHEQTLRSEFDHLEAVARTGDLDAIRGAIRRAVDAALASCEEIRRSRELVIAQLRDEIHSLHREVDQERRAAHTDPATGLWNRAKLDQRIQDLVLLNESFCVFLAGVTNLAQVGARDPRLIPGCLRAAAARLEALAGHDGQIGMAGRWSEEVFALIFNLPLRGAPVTLEQVRHALGGNYSVQLDGESHLADLEIRAEALERPKDSSEPAFYLRLGQAAFAVIAR